MSQFPVIRDVSETLQALLEDNTSLPSVDVTLTSPQSVTLQNDHLLNLYLYQVTESPFAKNRGPLQPSPEQLQRAPLALNLYYMLTPYVKDAVANTDEHLILGDAMRIFYDHPVITDPHLRGSLQGSGESMVLVLCKLNLEEQTRIWNALQMSYRLSVCYEIRIALLDSSVVSDTSLVRTQETLYGQL